MADRCQLKVDRWIGVESKEADGVQVSTLLCRYKE